VNVPALCISNQAVLSLHAIGRATGVVVDIDDEMFYSVPILRGLRASACDGVYELGDDALGRYLRKLLADGGFSLSPIEDLETMRYIKKRRCYVASDYKKELQTFNASTSPAKTYDLHSSAGKTITIGNEQFRMPESLFIPSLIGIEMPGAQQCEYNSILKCHADIRRTMYGNIVLTGSVTMFPGIAERLHLELSK